MGRLAARLLETRAALPARPRVVISLGETLTAIDADTIGRAFGGRVVNQYSAWEAPHMAQTCPDNPDVLHVNSERVILRVLRDDGAPASPGERGRIVVTPLDNHVMPFINYDIGDSAVPGGACACGRGLPTLASVEGRFGEAIRTPGGRIVSAPTLDGVFRSVGQHVREFQAVQTAPDTITLRVVPAAALTPEVAAELETALGRYAGIDVRVRVEAVARIQPEPSGKRFVVKALPADPGRDASSPARAE
jgi:phenylacetate-CoA ligase